MRDRLEKEIELLRRNYPSVLTGTDEDWVIIDKVPLPTGYNRDVTDVLFFIPSGYPETPPDNFFVPAGLRLEGGGQPDAFNPNHRTHRNEQWDRYSWHLDNGWSPAASIEEGSNLLTFMGSVEDRLQEVE